MLKTELNNLKRRSYDGETVYHEENQYINLIDDILREGVMVNGRNGNTMTVLEVLLLRYQEISYHCLPETGCVEDVFKELLWFISGSTDNKILKLRM